jgi:membrane-associated protein
MIETIFEFLRTLWTPERLIPFLAQVLTSWVGYAMLFGIVFAETGLLVGFIFPGDSLLFTVGVVAGAGNANIAALCLVMVVGAVLGDQSGYFLGYRTGPKIFSRPDSRFFKQQYVRETNRFYEKHGGKTLIYAKFVPIVRTFAPFMAGVGKMRYVRFLSFNVFGGIGWVLSMTILGYYLGGFPFIRRHFEKVVLLIIFLSVLPMIIHGLKAKMAGRQAAAPNAQPE